MGFLEAQDSSLALDVQRTMFTFEDISLRLHGRDIASVLRDIPEEELLKALKLGELQGSATVAFVLENLPRRLSERYVEELAALEDVTRKEGEAAQIEITKAIQAQAKDGTIRLIEKDAGLG
jgi:flagellar motor switch protein FliG